MPENRNPFREKGPDESGEVKDWYSLPRKTDLARWLAEMWDRLGRLDGRGPLGEAIETPLEREHEWTYERLMDVAKQVGENRVGIEQLKVRTAGFLVMVDQAGLSRLAIQERVKALEALAKPVFEDADGPEVGDVRRLKANPGDVLVVTLVGATMKQVDAWAKKRQPFMDKLGLVLWVVSDKVRLSVLGPGESEGGENDWETDEREFLEAEHRIVKEEIAKSIGRPETKACEKCGRVVNVVREGGFVGGQGHPVRFLCLGCLGVDMDRLPHCPHCDGWMIQGIARRLKPDQGEVRTFRCGKCGFSLEVTERPAAEPPGSPQTSATEGASDPKGPTENVRTEPAPSTTDLSQGHILTDEEAGDLAEALATQPQEWIGVSPWCNCSGAGSCLGCLIDSETFRAFGAGGLDKLREATRRARRETVTVDLAQAAFDKANRSWLCKECRKRDTCNLGYPTDHGEPTMVACADREEEGDAEDD